MWRICVVNAVLLLLIFNNTSFAEAAFQADAIFEEQIKNATWMMYSWKVLGWQYDSPYWKKGNEEKGNIGQARTAGPASKVRAVCLGLEEDYYVFFTLRSFIDPTFPNLFIQGINDIPRKKDKTLFTDKDVKSESYIRYGGISLVRYVDVGALHKIGNKIFGVTHYEQENPKSYGRSIGSRYLGDYYETIDNVKYEIPHKHVSAKQHLELQKKPKVIIKVFDEHDVALIYVPKHLFKSIDVDALGMKNPTLSVILMLDHNKELFGFKYVLIGQETLDLIKGYVPGKTDEKNSGFSGFQKIIKIAGLALGPETLHILHTVDSALDTKIPDEFLTAKDRVEAMQIVWEKVDLQIQKIINNKTMMGMLRNYIIPRITGTTESEPR